MLDPVQLILLSVIIILTVLFVILGIQVFLILTEVRKTVAKTNGILEKADSITEYVKSPLSAISSLSLGIKATSLLGIAKYIRNFLNQKDDHHEKRHNG